MEDIEKRARELLALAFMKRGDHLQGTFALSGEMDGSPTINAIIAALTPPDGYMLVPVKMTDEIGDALREAMDYGYCAESAWDLAIHAANKEVTK